MRKFLRELVPPFLLKVARKLTDIFRRSNSTRKNELSSAEYWTGHNVTNHAEFSSPEASLKYLEWRNAQYIGYSDFMPTDQASGKVVLDFGCGPGHDLVGFAEQSKPSRLVGVDVSRSSIDEARKRLSLHSDDVQLELLAGGDKVLPFDDGEFDIIHSSGVIHHIMDKVSVLREFRRILKPSGYCQVMIYNYHSVWMHLYANFIFRQQQAIDFSVDKRDVFKYSTDGEQCPISECFTADQFEALCQSVGLRSEYMGTAISLSEMGWLPKRFEAMASENLDDESREFLGNLTFSDRLLPLHEGNIAGIDSCYRLFVEK